MTFGLGNLRMREESIQFEEWKRCQEIFSCHVPELFRFIGQLSMPGCPPSREAALPPFRSPIQNCAHTWSDSLRKFNPDLTMVAWPPFLGHVESSHFERIDEFRRCEDVIQLPGR